MRQQNKPLWQLFLSILVVVLLFCTLRNLPAQTVPQIAEKALAATVSLEMQDRDGEILGFGSGFFIRDKLIATNYHVIEGATQGTAKLVGKDKQYTIEGFTAADKINDLALLKVTVYGVNPLPLGDSDTVRIGETVYVAGNPLGLEGTVSDGIISGRRSEDTKEHLQMTAPISPGSSGGPVLNSKGEVIGVSVATYRRLEAQNLNFAIPSNTLKTLLTRSGNVKLLSEEKSISAETYLIRGNEKTRLGDYKAGISDYTQAIHLKPDFAKAYFIRGIAKSKLGNHFAAIADYDMAIRLEPDFADAYFFRGDAKSDLGQDSAAIADYDMVIQLKPHDADAYIIRGIAKSKLGNHFAAIADYDIAIRLKPDGARSYFLRGIAKSDLGQDSAAIADYNMVVRLKPHDASAYYNRGRVKQNLEQDSAAIADYDAAIRLEYDFADAYFFRGNAKGSLGDYFAAIADYDVVIRLEPTNAQAYAMRGITKRILKHYGEARQDLQTAWNLADKDDNQDLKAHIEKYLKMFDK